MYRVAVYIILFSETVAPVYQGIRRHIPEVRCLKYLPTRMIQVFKYNATLSDLIVKSNHSVDRL
jgi:hypothetical protein